MKSLERSAGADPEWFSIQYTVHSLDLLSASRVSAEVSEMGFRGSDPSAFPKLLAALQVLSLTAETDLARLTRQHAR